MLVIGGGIAGIQASLDLAAMGLPVTLVEAGPSLGGVMAQLDKTFPTNDCAMCILSPRLAGNQPQSGHRSGYFQPHRAPGRGGRKFPRRAAKVPRYVDPRKCTGCGECTRVCPVKIPDPYNIGLKQTKAIHLPFPQAVPLSAYIQPEACRFFQGKKCEACVKICPADAINLREKPQDWILDAGAVIVALGARPATLAQFFSPPASQCRHQSRI